ARREPVGSHCLWSEKSRSQRRADPRRRFTEKLHSPDGTAKSGSPRPARERPRLLPPDYRCPARYGWPERRDTAGSNDLGQSRPAAVAGHGHLLSPFDRRAAVAHSLCPSIACVSTAPANHGSAGRADKAIDRGIRTAANSARIAGTLLPCRGARWLAFPHLCKRRSGIGKEL